MNCKFFGLNVKLTLMLVAICSMFASCYEKEEISKPVPSTQAPVYLIEGVVTDAATGTVLANATVNGTAVNADGKYSIKGVKGLNQLAFAATGYQTAHTSINIEEKENGTTTVYTVNAGLNLGEGDEEIRYKEVEYHISGKVTNEQGTDVEIKSIYVAGATTQPVGAVGTSKFEFTESIPGTYNAYVTADGYIPANATIYVSAVTPMQGDGKQTVEVKVAVVMQKAVTPPTPVEPIYYVQGNLYNEKGEGINNANVKLTTKSGYSNNQTTTGGFFYFEIASSFVKTMTIGTLNCTQDKYYPYATSFLLLPVEAGTSSKPVTSTITITGTLKAISSTTPGEDVNVGGSGSADMDVEDAKIETVEKAGETATKEEIEKAVDKALTGSTGSVDASEVANIIDDMRKDGQLNNVAEIATVKVETPKAVELSSTISVGEGSSSTTKEEVDQITIPAGVVVYAKGQAENVVLTRDPATEKATAATRIFTGEPSGAIFTNPLTVKFDSPIAIADAPDFDLNIMYEQKDGSWKLGDTKAVYNNGKFEGSVKHFSKFKFGFESSYKNNVADTVKLEPVFIKKDCYTGAAAQAVQVKFTYDGGLKYAPYDGKTLNVTPSLACAEQLQGCSSSTIAYVADMMTKMVKAKNLNINPGTSYSKQSTTFDIVVPAYYQISGFDVYRTEVSYLATIKVPVKGQGDKTVKVKVSKIIAVTLVPRWVFSHGHGHGEDLNAGGGIITAE